MKDAAVEKLDHSTVTVSRELDYDPGNTFETRYSVAAASQKKCFFSNQAARQMRWLTDPPKASYEG